MRTAAQVTIVNTFYVELLLYLAILHVVAILYDLRRRSFNSKFDDSLDLQFITLTDVYNKVTFWYIF